MATMLLASALTSCTMIRELAPVREDLSHVRDWIVVPVFFATNRQRAQTKTIDFLEERARKGGLQFGVKNIVVPAPDKVTVSAETMKRMGWQIIHLDKAMPQGKRPDVPASCAIPDKEYANKEVITGFDKYRTESGSKKVVFFVHGCCAPFQASLERSAKIAANMQVPLVVYDWNSPKGFSKYLENETIVEQTTDDFYDFLNAVEAVVPPENTTLFGHSMGARFLDVALSRRADRARYGVPTVKYQEVIYSQPDTDARTYIRHNAQVAAQAEKTRIYFNATDGRLHASATAHGDFERLGRPGVLLGELCKIDNQDMMDITVSGTGHEIPFWVVGDVSRGDLNNLHGYDFRQIHPHYFLLQKNFDGTK